MITLHSYTYNRPEWERRAIRNDYHYRRIANYLDACSVYGEHNSQTTLTATIIKRFGRDILKVTSKRGLRVGSLALRISGFHFKQFEKWVLANYKNVYSENIISR